MKFASLGAFSLLFGIGATSLLHEVLGASAEVAYAAALTALVAINFLACRYLVFPGQRQRFSVQATQYLVSALGFRGLEYLAFLMLHTVFGAPYLRAIIVIQIVSFVAKFLFFDCLVFAVSERSR